MKLRALIAFATMAISLLHAQPQQQEGDKQPSKKPAAIRFEYTLTELNGKQRINVRKFEILTTDRGSLKTSSKVAVPANPFGATTPGTNFQFTYVDLGLSAEMKSVAMKDGMINLSVEVEETFLVPPEPADSGAISRSPSTRQVVVRTDTAVKPGVPTVLGTVEDVASTHSFELSVTATPL